MILTIITIIITIFTILFILIILRQFPLPRWSRLIIIINHLNLLHHLNHHHHNPSQNLPPPPPPPPSNAIIGNTAHCNSDTGTGSNFDSRYYGVMTTGAIDSSFPRTRSSSYRKVPDRSSGQSSLLCRCGSGGALLPSPSPPPCIPPVISGFARGAQSLPSTPNANRRLISLSPRLDRTFRLDIGSERRKQDHSIPGAQIQVPIPPPPPAPVLGMEPCYQGYNSSNAALDCSGAGVSESTVLASGMGMDEDPASSGHHHHRPSGARVRALNQVLSQQRRSLRYRTSSQPLMKVSSLVIGVVAVLIIGFIVLSPLFHILLP
uniref:Uncharacterized protein n=1 Tax=Tetranychus urticae TaxID=32264 RepID=T1JV76_TETUR